MTSSLSPYDDGDEPTPAVGIADVVSQLPVTLGTPTWTSGGDTLPAFPITAVWYRSLSATLGEECTAAAASPPPAATANALVDTKR